MSSRPEARRTPAEGAQFACGGQAIDAQAGFRPAVAA